MSARGFAAIGLHNPKCAANVGGAMRAAHCFGASLVVLGGQRPNKLIGHATDVMRTWKHVPVVKVADLLDAIPHDTVPVAVELVPGARSLPDITHPERAFYIFGPEDGSLPADIIRRCPIVVSVPTRDCLNLAMTVNIVLYDRAAKRGVSNLTRAAACRARSVLKESHCQPCEPTTTTPPRSWP